MIQSFQGRFRKCKYESGDKAAGFFRNLVKYFYANLLIRDLEACLQMQTHLLREEFYCTPLALEASNEYGNRIAFGDWLLHLGSDSGPLVTRPRLSASACSARSKGQTRQFADTLLTGNNSNSLLFPQETEKTFHHLIDAGNCNSLTSPLELSQHSIRIRRNAVFYASRRNSAAHQNEFRLEI